MSRLQLRLLHYYVYVFHTHDVDCHRSTRVTRDDGGMAPSSQTQLLHVAVTSCCFRDGTYTARLHGRQKRRP